MCDDSEIITGWNRFIDEVLSDRIDAIVKGISDKKWIIVDFSEVHSFSEVLSDQLLCNPSYSLWMITNLIELSRRVEIDIRIAGLLTGRSRRIEDIVSSGDGQFYSVVGTVTKLSCPRIEEDRVSERPILLFDEGEIVDHPIGDLKRIDVRFDNMDIDELKPGFMRRFNCYLDECDPNNPDSPPYLIINSVEQISSDDTLTDFTGEDVSRMKMASSDPDFFDCFYRSVTPDMKGNDEIRMLLALQLFGCPSSHADDGTAVKGGIDILIASSDIDAVRSIQRRMSQLSPKGLLVSDDSEDIPLLMQRDPSTKGNGAVNIGAMSISNGGLLCINRMDDYPSEQFIGFREAMTVLQSHHSVEGVDIQCPTDTAVLASAKLRDRPINDSDSFITHIELPHPVLSYFIMVRYPDDTCDTEGRDVTVPEKGRFSDDFIRRYVALARDNCVPIVNRNAIKDAIEHAQERMKDIVNGPSDAQYFNRHFIRLSFASARSRLSESVERIDFERAYGLMRWVLEQYYRNDR